MEFNTAAWVSLIGFCCWIAPWLGSCSPKSKEHLFSGSYERSAHMQYVQKNPTLNNKLQSLLICIGVFCAILMLYQGFHLLHSGYEGLTNIEPTRRAGLVNSSRGKGSFLVLVFHFLPHLCISTSIYSLFTGRKFIKDCLNILIAG